MARKPVLVGGKRDELVAKSLQLFLEKGYESTSVRDILHAVNGEIGMFYHYFRSKDDIFEAAVQLYLSDFVSKFALLSQGDSFTNQLDAILDLFTQSTQAFVNLGGQRLHWSVAAALHQRTLHSMLPIVEDMVKKAVSSAKVSNPLSMEPGDLASFLLFGTSGVLHQKPFTQYTQEELAQKRAAVKVMASRILGLEE